MFSQRAFDNFPLHSFPRLLEGANVSAGHGGQFKVLSGEAFALGHDDSAANAIFQFAHISRPGMTGQSVKGLLVESQARLLNLRGESLKEELGQKADVVFAFAQRRQDDLNHGQAVKQIFPESSAAMAFFRSELVAAVTRVSIWMACLPPTRSMHCSWRKRRSLTCNRQGNFADFIQEERSAVGGFEASFALGVGAGEGAFFMAEQFAFQKRFRDGAAVDGDERAFFPARCSDECACAAISLPVPLSPRSSTGASVVATLRMESNTARIGGAGAEHAFKGVAPQQLLHFAVFPFQLRHVEAAFQEEFQLFHFHRLAHEIVGARPDGAKRRSSFSPWPVMMTTLASRSKASNSDKVARPSSGSPGWGGSPKSSKTTSGRSA